MTFDYIKKLLADEEDRVALELQRRTQPLPKENLPPPAPPKEGEASKVQCDKVCDDDLQQYRQRLPNIDITHEHRRNLVEEISARKRKAR